MLMATNRLYIVVFCLKNLSSACHFASVCAAMSLLKFFQVQGKYPHCESIKTSDYVLLTCKIILNTRILEDFSSLVKIYSTTYH